MITFNPWKVLYNGNLIQFFFDLFLVKSVIKDNNSSCRNIYHIFNLRFDAATLNLFPLI